MTDPAISVELYACRMGTLNLWPSFVTSSTRSGAAEDIIVFIE